MTGRHAIAIELNPAYVDVAIQGQNQLQCEGDRRKIGLSSSSPGGVVNQELRDQARALGLDRLTDEDWAQFERATKSMERHLRRLPQGVPPAQEPAHVYRAKGDTP